MYLQTENVLIVRMNVLNVRIVFVENVKKDFILDYQIVLLVQMAALIVLIRNTVILVIMDIS
jgi:hypothetical protein